MKNNRNRLEQPELVVEAEIDSIKLGSLQMLDISIQMHLSRILTRPHTEVLAVSMRDNTTFKVSAGRPFERGNTTTFVFTVANTRFSKHVINALKRTFGGDGFKVMNNDQSIRWGQVNENST